MVSIIPVMGEEVSVKYCHGLLGLFVEEPNSPSLNSVSLILESPSPWPIWQARDYSPTYVLVKTQCENIYDKNVISKFSINI